MGWVGGGGREVAFEQPELKNQQLQKVYFLKIPYECLRKQKNIIGLGNESGSEGGCLGLQGQLHSLIYTENMCYLENMKVDKYVSMILT